MAIAEKIQQYIQELPASLQEEALDYVEYLLAKAKSKAVQQEEQTWSSLSLESDWGEERPLIVPCRLIIVNMLVGG